MSSPRSAVKIRAFVTRLNGLLDFMASAYPTNVDFPTMRDALAAAAEHEETIVATFYTHVAVPYADILSRDFSLAEVEQIQAQILSSTGATAESTMCTDIVRRVMALYASMAPEQKQVVTQTFTALCKLSR